MEGQPPVRVFLGEGGEFTVWTADEAVRLRRQHRVVGEYVGTLQGFPSQNRVLGLPLLLSHEEVSLGVEEGFLVVLNGGPKSFHCSSDKESPQAKRQRPARASWSDKLRVLFYRRSEEEAKKSSTDKPDKAAAATDESRMFQLKGDADASEFQTSPEQVKLPLVSSEELKTRIAVYRDLWHRGMFVTRGIKFGVEFLAYAGDPLLYHASLMVGLRGRSEDIVASDLVSMERLSCTTNKRAAFAYLDDTNEVKYVGIRWHSGLP